MIAALFVRTGGPYFGLSGIDPWDENRDARNYAGPWPVIAHPPCQRWGKMFSGSPSHVARTGERKVKGDDGGCFWSALEIVREFGGVLEHPFGSHAWPFFGLVKPPISGGWVAAGDGGWTCCVEQGKYGHYARKPTLLLVHKVPAIELPNLDWGFSRPNIPQWAIDKYGLKKALGIGEVSFRGGGKDHPSRIDTPEKFKQILVSLAQSVNRIPSEFDL